MIRLQYISFSYLFGKLVQYSAPFPWISVMCKTDAGEDKLYMRKPYGVGTLDEDTVFERGK